MPKQVILDFCAFCGAQTKSAFQPEEGDECENCGNEIYPRNCRCQGTFDAIDGQRMLSLLDGEEAVEPTSRKI